MLSADAGVVCQVGSVRDVFLLCSPFAELLFDWCSRHRWVPDEQCFSEMKMYFAFTAGTGWLLAPFEKV